MVAGKVSKSPTARVRPMPTEPRDVQIEQDIGFALRAAYEKTLKEPVPAELLDLLDKLR